MQVDAFGTFEHSARSLKSAAGMPVCMFKVVVFLQRSRRQDVDRQPRDQADPGTVLDVELHCPRAGCAVTEIRVRVEPSGRDFLRTLRDRGWRCPLCRERATVRWVQAANPDG